MTWCMSLICIKNLLEKSNCSVTVTLLVMYTCLNKLSISLWEITLLFPRDTDVILFLLLRKYAVSGLVQTNSRM